MNFIVDTGAGVSLIPHRYFNYFGINLKKTAVRIVSATGAEIPTYGEGSLLVSFRKLQRNFEWRFVFADVSTPLLGHDFLSAHRLLVDCGRGKLIDSCTQKITPIAKVGASIHRITITPNITHKHPVIAKILSDYQSKMVNTNNICKGSKVPNISHHIDTGISPATFAKSRPLFGTKLQAVKNQIVTLMTQGVIRPSSSAWASQIHLVPKKVPGSYRLCGDYRALNAITKSDRYPLPHISAFANQLHGKKVFSKIDISRAYHHIPVAKESIEKTAIITPIGLYEFLRMPFGLKNGPATFQRYMDNIFREFPDIFIYLDDILIASVDEESHLNLLARIFNKMAEYHIQINWDKCELLVQTVDFLGYQICIDGLRPVQTKVEAIENMTRPKTLRELQSYLGMLNFYRKMIPNFSGEIFHLTELVRKSCKRGSLEWSQDANSTFVKSKQLLGNACLLRYPLPSNGTYHLVTDCSKVAMGAALHQIQNGNPVPIAFHSRKLTITQQRYSTYDRELFAAYEAVLHFKHLIESHHVILFTDHKPLVTSFLSQLPAKSDRQQRHLSIISEYVSAVEYVRGSDNVVADHLSRSVNQITIDVFDLTAIAKLQDSDQEVLLFADRLKSFPLNDKVNILCDVTTMTPRPFVPQSARFSIFRSLHDLAHPGINGSLKLIKERYFWPNLDKNVRTWVRECLKCQANKINRHTKSPTLPISDASDRFERIHIDILGPLPPSTIAGGSYTAPYKYLLTCIDRATRWMEVQPMADISAKTVANAFINCWISRFGVPLYVHSHRGTQFTSEIFAEISKLVGVRRLKTTGYHPQANGMIERLHRTFKTAIRARGSDWLDSIPIVLLGLRCMPLENGISPFTAVTGRTLLSPKIMLDKDASSRQFRQEFVQQLATRMRELDFSSFAAGTTHSSPMSYIPPGLSDCTHVWVRIDRIRRPLESPYFGPLPVIARQTKFYTVRLPDGREDNVSIDRLKPARLPVPSCSPMSEKVPAKSPNFQKENKEGPDTSGTSCPETQARQTYTSRFGRKVRFKTNPQCFYI